MTRSVLMTFGAAVLFGACNIPKNYNSYHTHLSLAASEVLTEKIAEIDGLGREDRVAVVNLAGPPGEDARTTALVNDALINALLAARVTVVERDSEALRTVVQEGAGDQLKYTVTSHTRSPTEQLVLDAELVHGGGPTRYLVNGNSYVMVPPDTALLDTGENGGDDVVSTNTPRLTNDVVAANKILEYRIIDVAIRDYTYKRETYRFANIVMHVRVVDARYGTVVYSGIIQDVVEDRVPALTVPKLRMAKLGGPDLPG